MVSTRRVTSPNRPPVAAPVIANGATGSPLPGSAAGKQAAHTIDTKQAKHGEDSVDDVVTGMRNATLEPKTPSLVVNGSGGALPEKSSNTVSRQSSSGDSQKADSTSDLGTKPPSLDGKSITSGTTFALDEKESLRPDDSASVKAAAVEDDDAFSIRDSLLASSRMGSDVAVRRMQSEDSSDRRAPHPAVAQVMTGAQGSPGAQPATSASISADALNATYRKAPDEKLLEAMQSQKDRLFLLRLEGHVVSFIQDSK